MDWSETSVREEGARWKFLAVRTLKPVSELPASLSMSLSSASLRSL